MRFRNSIDPDDNVVPQPCNLVLNPLIGPRDRLPFGGTESDQGYFLRLPEKGHYRGIGKSWSSMSRLRFRRFRKEGAGLSENQAAPLLAAKFGFISHDVARGLDRGSE